MRAFRKEHGNPPYFECCFDKRKAIKKGMNDFLLEIDEVRKSRKPKKPEKPKPSKCSLFLENVGEMLKLIGID